MSDTNPNTHDTKEHCEREIMHYGCLSLRMVLPVMKRFADKFDKTCFCLLRHTEIIVHTFFVTE